MTALINWDAPTDSTQARFVMGCLTCADYWMVTTDAGCRNNPGHRAAPYRAEVECVQCGWRDWFAVLPDSCTASTPDSPHALQVVRVAS